MDKIVLSRKGAKTAGAPGRKKAPIPAAELMATPKHMLAWLESKSPRAIVTEDMMDGDACLGAMFLRENGHPRAFWYATVGCGGGKQPYIKCHDVIGNAIISLCNRIEDNNPITAAQAIRAIKIAQQQLGA